MPQKMGLLYGLEKNTNCFKRPSRWLLEIPGVAADDTPSVDALPPEKGARPNISFKEMEVKHLIEDAYFPAKPEWKPITITLFDIVKTTNPIWDWLIKIYDAKYGEWSPSVRTGQSAPAQPKDKFIKSCYLKMFTGCGELIETWVYEDAWPSSMNFQTLDMSSSGYMTCELTLRYARAYLQ